MRGIRMVVQSTGMVVEADHPLRAPMGLFKAISDMFAAVDVHDWEDYKVLSKEELHERLRAARP